MRQLINLHSAKLDSFISITNLCGDEIATSIQSIKDCDFSFDDDFRHVLDGAHSNLEDIIGTCLRTMLSLELAMGDRSRVEQIEHVGQVIANRLGDVLEQIAVETSPAV